MDDTGRIVRELKVASEPEALLPVLTSYRFKRIGLEAGPLSQWLFSTLAEAGLPVICGVPPVRWTVRDLQTLGPVDSYRSQMMAPTRNSMA